MLSEIFSSIFRQLSHLWMNLKFYRSRIQAAAFTRLHEVISTSSLFRNQQPPKCCFSNPNKWSVTRYDLSARQCYTKQNTSDTRVATIIFLGTSVPSALDTGITLLYCTYTLHVHACTRTRARTHAHAHTQTESVINHLLFCIQVLSTFLEFSTAELQPMTLNSQFCNIWESETHYLTQGYVVNSLL